MQSGFNRRFSPRLEAEGDSTVMHWVGPWIDQAGAIESAGMHRGRRVKHAAVSRRLGFPDSVKVMWGQAHFIA